MTPTPKQLENRRILIAALRDRSKWPQGFEWDFRHRCGCALGLLDRLIFTRGGEFERENLGISENERYRVFIAPGPNGRATVTPEMVADRLERLFAEEGDE